MVGADSMIGKAVVGSIAKSGGEVWTTTRRPTGSRTNALHFDLGAPVELPSWVTPERAYICAARAGFQDCEEHPDDTHRVNVDGTVAIARSLLERGTFLVFLSTSAVFAGHHPAPSESEPVSPTTEYARQKAEAEQRLLELDSGHGRFAVVRLTKVLASCSPTVARFLGGLTAGHRIEAYSDLYLSPTSLGSVVAALHTIASLRSPGIHHLSGASILSYADLARHMARSLGCSADQVMEKPLSTSGSELLYTPRYPNLGMQMTQAKVGIGPEAVEDVVDSVLVASRGMEDDKLLF